jgi:hypothetical protein
VTSSSSQRTLARRATLTDNNQEDQEKLAAARPRGPGEFERLPAVSHWSWPTLARRAGSSRKVSLAVTMLLACGIAAFDSRQALLWVFVSIVIQSLLSRQKAGGRRSPLLPVVQGVCKSGSSQTILKYNHSAKPTQLAPPFGWSGGILTSGVHPLGLQTSRDFELSGRLKWY